MKKSIFFLILTFLFSTHPLTAQEVGEAAVASTETASSNQWKNWVFASSALVAVVIGVVIVSLNPGSTSH